MLIQINSSTNSEASLLFARPSKTQSVSDTFFEVESIVGIHKGLSQSEFGDGQHGDPELIFLIVQNEVV